MYYVNVSEQFLLEVVWHVCQINISFNVFSKAKLHWFDLWIEMNLEIF